jgi:hypothetical protein
MIVAAGEGHVSATACIFSHNDVAYKSPNKSPNASLCSIGYSHRLLSGGAVWLRNTAVFEAKDCLFVSNTDSCEQSEAIYIMRCPKKKTMCSHGSGKFKYVAISPSGKLSAF